MFSYAISNLKFTENYVIFLQIVKFKRRHYSSLTTSCANSLQYRLEWPWPLFRFCGKKIPLFII